MHLHPSQQRQTLSVQFLFILHGVMEIVVDTSDKVDADWKAHLKSREVWTAAKLYARDSEPTITVISLTSFQQRR